MLRTQSQRTELSIAAALNQDDLSLMEKKHALFIQQFKKEAQERMDESESRMENDLATIVKYFDIELMKMPPSLQQMRIGDLMNGLSAEEFFERLENKLLVSSLSDVSIVVKGDSSSMPPLTSSSRRRVKGAVSSLKAEAQKTTKASKGGKMRTLVNSHSTGSLRGKTRSFVAKTSSDQTTTPKPQLRSVVSAGDLQLTIQSSKGKKVCLTEENKEDIDLSELDAGAVGQILKLKGLVDFLVGKLDQHQ